LRFNQSNRRDFMAKAAPQPTVTLKHLAAGLAAASKKVAFRAAAELKEAV
jgi:hypothetical protein